MPCCHERSNFFAPAAEDHGIPAFETADSFTAADELHEQTVDLLLRDRRLPGLLTDRDQLGVAACVVEHINAHESVIEHDVGLSE